MAEAPPPPSPPPPSPPPPSSTKAPIVTLPVDILFQILSYSRQVTVGTGDLTRHPYLVLSLVCKRLNAVVEDYTHHLLRISHHRFAATKRTVPAPPFLDAKRGYTYRQVFLTDAAKRCHVCHTSTKQVIRGDPVIRCCRRCSRTLNAERERQRLPGALLPPPDFGVPEHVIKHNFPEGIASEELVIFAAKFHGVSNIQEYFNAKSAVYANARKAFFPISANLWQSQHARLSVLQEEWRKTLAADARISANPARFAREMQKRRQEWSVKCAKERKDAWSAQYPWYGNIEKTNQEIYKFLRDRQASDRSGIPGGPLQHPTVLIVGQSLTVDTDGEDGEGIISDGSSSGSGS